MRRYVVGFAHDGSRMAFIRKNRPEWQAGLLNGIGGKVEEGESYYRAQTREFFEEAGILLGGWRQFATMTYPSQAEIVFHTVRVPSSVILSLRACTDEPVVIHSIDYVKNFPNEFIHNLRWLVPLAVHIEEYSSVNIVGHTDPLLLENKPYLGGGTIQMTHTGGQISPPDAPIN